MKDLDAISAAVKANWNDTTPDNQKGLVGGEIETAIRMSIGADIAAISSKLPSCSVDDPMKAPGFVATTLCAIDGGEAHYLNLLDKTAAAYRQMEQCIQPSYGPSAKVEPTSATGHQGLDAAVGIVPGSALVRDAVKVSKDNKKMKAAEDVKTSSQIATGINGPALQAEAAARNLRQIMKIPQSQ